MSADYDRRRTTARRMVQRSGSPYRVTGRSDIAQRNRHIAGAATLGLIGGAGLLALGKLRPGFVSLFRNTAPITGKRLAPPVGGEKFWVSQRMPIWKSKGKTVALGDLWGRYNAKDPSKSLIYQLPIQTRARRSLEAKATKGYLKLVKKASIWRVLGYDETMRVAQDVSRIAKQKVGDPLFGKNSLQSKVLRKADKLVQRLYRPVDDLVRKVDVRSTAATKRLANRVENRQARIWPMVAAGVAIGGGSAELMRRSLKKDRELGPYRVPVSSAGLTSARQGILVRDGKQLHENLVHSIAKRYAKEGLSYEDIAGAGRLGLVEAAKRFDPKRGLKFSTYATPWVRSSIQREIGRGFTVRLPERKIGKVEGPGIAPIEAAMDKAAPSILEANFRGDTLSTLPRHLRGLGRRLDPAALEEFSGLLRRGEQMSSIQRRIGRLPEQQQRVIRLKYLSGRPMAGKDIAKALRLSPGRVVQLEQAAVKRLKAG